MDEKLCKGCKTVKSKEFFYRDSRLRGGLSSYCKECQIRSSRNSSLKNLDRSKSSYNRWKEKNPDRYKELQSKHAEKRKKARKEETERTLGNTKLRNEWLANYLKENPCVDCGETNLLVLEFDHVDPSTKLFNIGQLRKMNFDKLKIEIAKCDVVCSNCHKIRTAKRCNSWRLAYV